MNDIKKDGLNTLRKLIKEYAPSVENDTGAYIAAVSKRTGILPNEKIAADRPTMVKLAEAISFHENGGSYITMVQIVKAWGMI